MELKKTFFYIILVAGNKISILNFFFTFVGDDNLYRWCLGCSCVGSGTLLLLIATQLSALDSLLAEG